ncbi:DUF3883 domain-containing protein [Pseudomonas sp. SL4(2022)]|uniref:protein NO VEIN domain-containing protein n=1 Tax=Pseudomonas sp. SL4(2022) TaxID=2994661 RepID=UPI00226ED7EB|nr:DUF3883 domain-containing protein [Pseudomonas sp. SL4(2022)]WAC44616.1 DUF3883 domain-containing protein [Pseudomonas sp. SL4(2022)]
MDRIAFVKTGWATSYEGEEVVGRHAHIGEFNEAHERFNFRKAPDGRFYGYIPPLGRHESAPSPRDSSGWLLIFVAARNGNGPLTVVGWYENAVFEYAYVTRPEYEVGDFEMDIHGNHYSYCFSADRATLIPLHLRQTVVSGDHFKRSPIIYARGNGRNEAWRQEFAVLAESILELAPSINNDKAPTFKFPDAEHRKQVEIAAVNEAKRVFETEYRVTDRQDDNCGYDLLLIHKKTGEELHVEVKGTSTKVMHFFMTRNEQKYLSNPKWRLYMVTEALLRPKGTLMNLAETYKVFDLVPFAWEGVARS